MFPANSLLPALIVALSLGVAAAFYFWNVRRRQDEAMAGIRAISGMRWREFSHFVLDAMRHRGYDVLTPSDEAERGQQCEFLLSKGGQRWLLSCKHGSAYRIAAPAVAELASSIRFQGASGGLLVTPGQIEADARAAAPEAKIELIDGMKLWPEIAPLLPPGLRDSLHHDADLRARRHIGFAWLAAAALGAILMLLGGQGTDTPAQQAPAMASRPARVVPRRAAPVPAEQPAVASAATTPTREEEQRVEVIRTISSLPGVDRALWSTRSTLLVHLVAGAPDRVTEICAVLERYENLRTSRVQLQPPPGSTDQVRFRQCRTF